MNLIKRAGVYRELAILTAMLILTALLSFPRVRKRRKAA